MLMTALTPLCNTNEMNQWQNRPFTNSWPEPSHQKYNTESSVTKTIKKKNKRFRTSYTTDQIMILERTFARIKYVNKEHRKELAELLNISERCVKVWFQNRRMKKKKENSESSCDSTSDFVGNSPPPVNTTSYQQIGTHYQYTDYINFNEHVNTNYNMNPFYSENFGNDTIIYPSHYYPSTEALFTNSYINLDECQHPREEELGWSANAFDLNFL